MQKKILSPARTVGVNYHGQRLDNYLAREMKGAPRPLIYRLIRTGQVRINGRRSAPSSKLCAGDELRIPDNISLAAPAAAAPPATLPVIYEDSAFLAVNKPSGMAVHGGTATAHGVVERLRTTHDGQFLELAHRLDKSTSGVLLLAKKSSALRGVQSRWRARQVNKIYHALVFGKWSRRAAVISLPLKRTAHGIGGMVAKDGRPALTRTTLLEAFPAAAMVRADIITGRTHQLRIHLAAVGLPIVGDDKYGDFAANRKLGAKRTMLHASVLSFEHPLTGEKLDLRAPLPDDFAATTRLLQQ